MANPNVFAHGMPYVHGFVKKCDGNNLCAMSSIDRFFVHRLRNSTYWPFQSTSR
ncbi:hypothetical protein BHE74_00039265 [Ensete ventricosum]|nr:hypothetical protein BHE74_00039265 [Ensete ventricosum]